jgi:hypothetical protein
MNRPLRGSMRHLGTLRGRGTLSCDGIVLGAADYEIDGFCTRPGEVVGSGEITMAPAELANAFGRRDLELATEDGMVLSLRFSGGRLGSRAAAAHADITGGLPAEDAWRR